MRVININTREVLFDDTADRNFTVYAIAVENTSESFDYLMETPGLVEWATAAGDLTEDEAIARVAEIYS